MGHLQHGRHRNAVSSYTHRRLAVTADSAAPPVEPVFLWEISLAGGNTTSLTGARKRIASPMFPPASARLTGMALYCRRIGTPTGVIRWQLYDSGTSVPATVRTASPDVNVLEMQTSMDWLRFDWPESTVMAGTRYWFGPRGTNTASNSYPTFQSDTWPAGSVRGLYSANDPGSWSLLQTAQELRARFYGFWIP